MVVKKKHNGTGKTVSAVISLLYPLHLPLNFGLYLPLLTLQIEQKMPNF